MPSARDSKLIALASREVSPEHVDEFQPITRGPIFAMLGLAALGAVACLYMIARKLAGIFKSKESP